jgi:hypothetical protein
MRFFSGLKKILIALILPLSAVALGSSFNLPPQTAVYLLQGTVLILAIYAIVLKNR